jgi:hypothetical protein
VWAIVIVGLSCLPYLLAWQLAPAGTQYTGLLINHLDGESYYAKMRQGARGDWLFHLPFTPEPHEGTFVYVFYLALGQIAGALQVSPPWIYHLARAGAGLFFLLVGYRFIAHFYPHQQTRRTAFLLLGLSAGFGWLLAPLGMTTADLWVAEGFSFLSILINPHFPLIMALMLLIFLIALEDPIQGFGPRRAHDVPDRVARLRLLASVALGILLALVQPLAVPLVLIVLGTYIIVLTISERCLPWNPILIAGAALTGAAPILIYDLWAFRTNPALAAWSAQNLTPSLPPWDYALGYGLVLLLALSGIWVALKRRTNEDLFLLSWVGSVAILLYVPFALQRRFITGLHVPLVLLATLGLQQVIWPRLRQKRRKLFAGLLIGVTALTSLFVPLVSVVGVAQGQFPLVMNQDGFDAYTWLRKNTLWTDTVLTPAELGAFVPAWAGNRVVYGHPFETIEAEQKKAEVEHFYDTDTSTTERQALLDRYGVRYVLVRDLVPDTEALALVAVWKQGDLTLYRMGNKP